MAIATVQLRHAFGFRSNLSSSVAYQDEQTIVFPAGSNLVLFNIDQKTQKFILGNEKSQGMSAMCVSPNRRYVALAEIGEKPCITIYDLQTLRKKKTLTTDLGVTEFTSIAFSPDSKYLAAQTGQPDWTLIYWAWEKSKQLASVKTSTSNNNPINQISFNPQDSTQLCVVGNGIFRLYRYSEGIFKQFGLGKSEPNNFLCHAWLSEDRVVAGTESGKWILMESGEQKAECNLLNFLKTDKSESPEDGDAGRINVTANCTSIVASSKGFAVACGLGTVHWFEKATEEKDKEFYKRMREIRIPADQNSADPTRSEEQIITYMTVSPSEETIVAATDNHQLYQITIATAELAKSGDHTNFEYLSQSFHNNQVTGLDVCIRKPLVATCGVDRSVRIWNYETNHLELYKEFAEEACSIALHPSGLYILVGFSDKLRLMNLLIDDIRTFKEFTVRRCLECAFSNGGAYFAAVYGNVIQIYSTSTFENINSFKGHNGKIKSIVWTTDDLKLISCGQDGAVYEWEVSTGKRLGEYVLKSCAYSGVTVTPDGKTTFAVGSDKMLREISESNVIREMPCGDVAMTTIVLSHSGKMMFCGTESGTVRSVKYPITNPGDWTEHVGHSSTITKAKITYNDDYLITVSKDSTVLIWRIQDKDGRAAKRDKEIGWAEEILITKSDLEEKNSIMAELKTRVDELKMENEYQLRLKDMNYNEKIKELTEKFIQEMESLKTKNQVLKTEKEKEETKHEEQMQEILEKQNKEVQELEAANSQKLMLEYDKYQELQAKSQKMQEDYERQLKEMDESRQRALEEQTEYFETKLAEKCNEIDELNRAMRDQTTEYEETKRLLEEDSDREILDTKIKYERRLRDEKEENNRLKAEAGVMKKKYSSLEKEMVEYKEDIKKVEAENNKLKGIIKNLEKDLEGLKKEIQERDETIQDKEKRIYDLKKKNQELEKFKFVLDYKIKELKKQIEPRENDIKKNKEQIQEMESELERFHKQNTQLELSINELKQKLKATEKELANERQSTRNVEAVVKRFKTDLHNCVGYIQEPKMLKENIKVLYSKYVQEDVTGEASVDKDIQKEFARQREYLEHSVASLKKKLVKDTEIHRADYVRIMQENVSLIKEINDLRRDLKQARTHIHDLEAALGLHRKQASEQAKQLLTSVTNATKSNPMLEENYEEAKRVMETQRNIIAQLRERVTDLENRPLSSTGRQLPPIEDGATAAVATS